MAISGADHGHVRRHVVDAGVLQVQRRAPARPARAARPRPAPPRPAGAAPRPGPARPRTATRGRRSGAGRGTGSGPGPSHVPSSDKIAGRKVSEPSTATPTTRIVPTATPENTSMPVRNSPAREIITVSPDTTMARPEVRGGDPQRLAWCRARRALLAGPAQVEQRVVDADRHPDQQHDRGGGAADRQPAAGDGQQRDRRRSPPCPPAAAGCRPRSARRTRSAAGPARPGSR